MIRPTRVRHIRIATRTTPGGRRGCGTTPSTVMSPVTSRSRHETLVRRRGVTRIVATSASRLREHVHRGEHHDEELDDRDVTDPDARRQCAADAGIVEQELDDDHATGEVGDVEGDHLEHRTERVRHRVPPHHGSLGGALEAGHLDVVALHHLDQRRPGDPRDVGDGAERERRGRQDHLIHVLPRSVGADLGDCRQPLARSASRTG